MVGEMVEVVEVVEQFNNFRDIMVDIETTSTLPDRGAILQIAAVKFNLVERKVCHEFFNRSLTIPGHRGWSEGTREFWMAQKPEVLIEIMSKAEPWDKVMKDLHDWCIPTGHYNFWAKPTHFDFNFIQSYYNDLGMNCPFHYRYATDMNSFAKGLFFPGKFADASKIEFTGDRHNALYDTLHQIKQLFFYADEAEKRRAESTFIVN